MASFEVADSVVGLLIIGPLAVGGIAVFFAAGDRHRDSHECARDIALTIASVSALAAYACIIAATISGKPALWWGGLFYSALAGGIVYLLFKRGVIGRKPERTQDSE